MFHNAERMGAELRLTVTEASTRTASVTGRVTCMGTLPTGPMRARLTGPPYEGIARVELREDGSFEFIRQVSGEYQLAFLHGPFGTTSFMTPPVTVRLSVGHDIDLGEVPVAPPGSLKIHLVAPIRSDTDTAAVDPLPSDFKWTLERTDLDAVRRPSAEFSGLSPGPIHAPPGRYTLHLESALFHAAPVQVEIESNVQSEVRIPFE